MRLISYDPFLGSSPYRQPGPIFVHEDPKCKLADFTAGIEAEVPDQQYLKEQLALRVFDGKHMMVGFEVVKGRELVEKTEEWFEKMERNGSEGPYAHVHYAAPGCFAVRIDKA